MISAQVDLTERRDFRGELNFGAMIRASALEDVALTLDEYQNMVVWESVFGPEQHQDRSAFLFGRHCGNAWYCEACGRPLKPWSEIELCARCDQQISGMSIDNGNNRGLRRHLLFPWSHKPQSADVRDDPKRIFRLR